MQLKRLYLFKSVFGLESADLLLFDKMPDRDEVFCACILREFKIYLGSQYSRRPLGFLCLNARMHEWS